MSKDIRDLSDLVGEEMSAVCFGRDYVEFHFDGPILRSLSNPSAFVDGKEHHFPDMVWREDAASPVLREFLEHVWRLGARGIRPRVSPAIK